MERQLFAPQPALLQDEGKVEPQTLISIGVAGIWGNPQSPHRSLALAFSLGKQA